MRNAKLVFVPALIGASLLATEARGGTRAASQPSAAGIPADARYACPMQTHPDESDPTLQGPYFSKEDGTCPRCGMDLKPLDELSWVQARRAAAGAEVAYTCPDHQHVFSRTEANCPRCGRKLEPFKVMYTCPQPEHAGVIATHEARCPRCGRALAPFRGVWLSEAMAAQNAPPNPDVADSAAYRCPVHPLVHSDQPGKCVICARNLQPAGKLPEAAPQASIPEDARFVCPMKECWHFTAEEGNCPVCGMKLKPIADVEWARQAVAKARAGAGAPQYVCPMHPQVRSGQPGTCTVCGMRLVSADAVPQPTSAPAAIATQVNYLMEHYLELQKRFASDRTTDVALHALGLVGAADAIITHLDDPDVHLPAEFRADVRKLRAAALRTTGKDLEADRVTFVDLGAAMRLIIEHVRPDKNTYPKIYIFHCPMTKGDWLQVTDEMANPFYGFKMLKCGKPVETR